MIELIIRMMEEVKKEVEEPKRLNFLEEIIESDLKSGKMDSILTRFPPEPNGYLHLGHAKSICINFGLAQKYGGKTNLRFDDTNPTKEDTEYVDSIKEDIQWLGFQWDKERYASDYFDQLYEWAEDLIKRGLAYVDDQTQEEISKGRGTVDKPGVESPYRNRSVEENLQIFRDMKEGGSIAQMAAPFDTFFRLFLLPVMLFAFLLALICVLRVAFVRGDCSKSKRKRRLLLRLSRRARAPLFSPFILATALQTVAVILLLLRSHLIFHLNFSSVSETLTLLYATVLYVKNSFGTTTLFALIAFVGGVFSILAGYAAGTVLRLSGRSGK